MREKGTICHDYLVPGSIRLDCRLIGEEEEEEKRGKKVDILDM